jgi:endonuclease YncB( thermonuclease family)
MNDGRGWLRCLLILVVYLGSLTGCSLSQDFEDLARDFGAMLIEPATDYWTVERVHDGDTLWVERAGVEEKIRLCGIDAPELAQPLGKTSRDHLKDLVAQSYNGKVGVIPVERDPYGRLVAEIYVPITAEQEISANSQMVMDGLAYVYKRHVGGCPHGDAIAAAEPRAKSLAKGVWEDNQLPPWQYRQQNS